MKTIKETLKDKVLMRYSIFIIFTVFLLTIFYFIVKNIAPIAGWANTILGDFLGAISPLIIGLVLAYLINPVVNFIDKRLMRKIIKLPNDPSRARKRTKRARILSTLLAYLMIVAIIVGLIYGFAALIVGNFVIKGLSGVIDSTMHYVHLYEETFRGWIQSLPRDVVGDRLADLANGVLTWWNGNFNATAIIEYVTSFGGSIFNFVIGVIISIYLVSDKDFFIGLWNKLLRLTMSEERLSSTSSTLGEVNGVLTSFVKGVSIDAVAVAILSSVFLSILGLDFAVFVGIFAGIANVIPYFGPVLGMIPAFLIGSFTDGIWQGVIAVVLLLIVQQIDCNIIYPKVVGSSTGLHPLFVLLAVTIVGAYGGIAGMILAVPIAGILQIFVKKWVNYISLKKGVSFTNLDSQYTPDAFDGGGSAAGKGDGSGSAGGRVEGEGNGSDKGLGKAFKKAISKSKKKD